MMLWIEHWARSSGYMTLERSTLATWA